MLKRLLLSLCIVSLGGCGFQLRGTINLPPNFNNVAIISEDASNEISLSIKSQLQAYHVEIIPDATRASYILILEKDALQQQITSVSASTTPRQYQLIYTLTYSLLKNKDKPIVSSNSITVSRQLTVNNDRVLGSDYESSLIIKEMRRDAAMQLVMRLGKKLVHTPVLNS